MKQKKKESVWNENSFKANTIRTSPVMFYFFKELIQSSLHLRDIFAYNDSGTKQHEKEKNSNNDFNSIKVRLNG
mgnify:CR=1 FL=1